MVLSEMKNISDIKSKNTVDSPKTPGGISKSLLTPCRRVGLSRNWRKSGPSPFISPLSSCSNTSPEVLEIKKQTRKRKLRICEEEILQTPEKVQENLISEGEDTPGTCEFLNADGSTISSPNNVSVETPQKVDISRKKKLKILSTTINKCDASSDKSIVRESCLTTSSILNVSDNKKNPVEVIKQVEKVYTDCLDDNINTDDSVHVLKEKCPSDLTKKCVVVIQKKIFKKHIDNAQNKNVNADLLKGIAKSQTLFDSDTDDVPLSNLNTHIAKDTTDIKDTDEDFIPNKQSKQKNIKIASPKTNKNNPDRKKSMKSKSKVISISATTKPSSQSSVDDDEDLDFDTKKTILIRKTYNKVSKPTKAKSTGSIMDKDIDELQTRIEMKKKLLVAKAMTTETAELRCLIKKWQKGCQDALLELMELMSKKFPEQNMDFSEMLQMLKIPPDLVGFDSENDCFLTPNDEHVVLSAFDIY